MGNYVLVTEDDVLAFLISLSYSLNYIDSTVRTYEDELVVIQNAYVTYLKDKGKNGKLKDVGSLGDAIYDYYINMGVETPKLRNCLKKARIKLDVFKEFILYYDKESKAHENISAWDVLDRLYTADVSKIRNHLSNTNTGCESRVIINDICPLYATVLERVLGVIGGYSIVANER